MRHELIIIGMLTIRSYVWCFSFQDEGQVRLTNEFSGLLEVFYDGEWGYVCDDGWQEINGDVVCNILGYDGAISSSTRQYSSDVNYRLNFINCTGSETDLLDCSYGLYTPNYCSVDEHVYISCTICKFCDYTCSVLVHRILKSIL